MSLPLDMGVAEVQKILSTAGVQFDPGLREKEFDAIEARFGFRFPPDLREFLAAGLPIPKSWVNWRGADEASIRGRLAWPADGICFDVEHNEFWLPEWGPKPERLHDAFQIARRAVAEAPVLIPIFSHRYIPATPLESGNPVLSVYQTDIIYYGANLMDYFQNEFNEHFGRIGHHISGSPRRVPFWSRFAENQI